MTGQADLRSASAGKPVETSGRRAWILSVGVNDYGGQRALPSLTAAVNDACLIFETLTQKYNFEGELLARARDIESGPHGRLLAHRSGNGLRSEIFEALARLRRRMVPTDIFVFFFAGHAARGAPARILPFGALHENSATHLLYSGLFGELYDLPCQHQLLLLDCCHAGASVRPLRGYSPISRGARHGQLSIIAAASESEEAIDDAIGVEGDRYSPFTAALNHVLTEKVRAGERINLTSFFGELYRWINDHKPQGAASWPLPVLIPEVPSIRSGGELEIRRPGLHVEAPAVVHTDAGQPIDIPLAASNWQDVSVSVEWRVMPHRAEFKPAISRALNSSGWTLRIDFAGRYDFLIVAIDRHSGEQASRTLTVIVQPRTNSPLSLGLPSLPLCKVGRPYDVFIPIEGGIGPYRCEVDGLPEPLNASVVQPEKGTVGPAVQLHGLVAESVDAGTPHSANDRPATYSLRFRVTDATGETALALRRLVVINEADYCLIPSGDFQVGYSGDHDRDGPIRDMLRQMANRHLVVGAELPERIKEIKRRFGDAWAQHIIEEAKASNPASRATLPDYYIKKYPVTNANWLDFLRARPSAHRPAHWGDADEPFSPEEADAPVVNVPYKAIVDYLQWKGTRLPTAWEWEKAARGTDGRLFPWGDEFDPARCNVRESGKGRLLPANSYDGTSMSPFGACDMVGNAAEWVDRRKFVLRDRRAGSLYQPFRGGSFLDASVFALTFRDSLEVGVTYGSDEDSMVVGDGTGRWLGFRDVVDLDAEPPEPQGLVSIPAMRLHQDGHSIDLPAFEMARYAVSNLEYLGFVEDTSHKPPSHWNQSLDPPFESARRHLPVVNVGYLDAMAFCLWKARKSERLIRLPSPQQWIAAVSGGIHRTFPWGDNFDSQRCNGITSGWGRRLPVFAFPEGCSAQGVFNLVGNACEWVSPGEVRGGSWSDDCETLPRVGFKFGVDVAQLFDFARMDIGFRYVANTEIIDQDDAET